MVNESTHTNSQNHSGDVDAASNSNANEAPKDIKNEVHSATASNNSIFVGNLPFDLTIEELVEQFGQFGQIVDKQVPIVRQVLKGFAYIQYKDLDSANKAIQNLNNTQFKGRTIKVDNKLENTNINKMVVRNKASKPPRRKFKQKSYNSREESKERNDKEAHTQDLPVPRIQTENDSNSDQSNLEQTQDESLEFEDIEKTAQTQRPRSFDNNNRGRRFRGRGRGSFERGRGGFVRRKPRQNNNGNNREEEQGSETTIYISNLTENTTEEDIKLLFEDFKTKNIELIKYKNNGKCKGYGFVEMENHEEQQKALKMEGSMAIGTTKVQLKKAFGQRRPRKENISNNEENNEEGDQQEEKDGSNVQQ